MTWWKDLFRGFNQPADNNIESDVKRDEDGDPLEALSFKLLKKGFHFNVEKDWYERTWLVATQDGAETSKEVYQKRGDHWKVIMYGNEGDVFFEQEVNGVK